VVVVVVVDIVAVVVCGTVDVDVAVVDVDDVVVCVSIDVDVASGVVVVGDDVVVVVVVVVSDFFGARMTNFKTRASVTAQIVNTIKDMQMIVIQR
jgi:hypothetical protein